MKDFQTNTEDMHKLIQQSLRHDVEAEKEKKGKKGLSLKRLMVWSGMEDLDNCGEKGGFVCHDGQRNAIRSWWVWRHVGGVTG
jgi:hypothetical protein